ncbi:MAG: phenylacetate--CoA ligase family protein [Candidatus Bathyarchaeia archaeon]
MVNYLRAALKLYSIKRHLRWKTDKLLKHQNTELKRVIRYAYNYVPYWHEKFKQIGLKPDDIKTIEDLNKLPIINKKEVRSNLSRILSVRYNKDKLKKVFTSGSTGQPLTLYLSISEDEFRKARHLRANIFCGQRMRDVWVVITSPIRFEKTLRLPRLFRIYSMNTISVYASPSEQIVSLKSLKPDVVEGYSSSLYMLAREIKKRGGENIKPRIMFSGTELIDYSHRQFIEKVFDAPLYDQYATIEFERMAWQCPEKTGYHIEADAMIMQFVDRDGEEVAPGERGEIVCTSLFNYAMPLIRYAVGDVGVKSAEECSCGVNFPLMEMVEGRSDSIIYLADGRPISPIAFIYAMQLFKWFEFIEQWRVVQEQKNTLRVDIKTGEACVNQSIMEEELAWHLRKILNLGADVVVRVCFVDDIPVDKSGKRMKVVSAI